MKFTRGILWCLGVFALNGALAMADTFQAGDVFASINNGTVAWYRSNGTFVSNLTFGSGYTTGSASDSTGLWVTNFGASTVTKWDSTGSSPTLFGGGYSTPEDILVDKSHDVFVSSTGGGLREFDSTGALLASFAGGQRIDWFDLSSDESTMYYTDESGTIHRWDLTTNTALADLGSGGAFALRLLGDGTLLAADRSAVNHIDATTGAILNTFTNSSFGDTGSELFSLNLDSDGTSFWTGDFTNGKLFKLKISDGSLLQTLDTGKGAGSLYGVSVFGEECAAGCGGPPPAVPEPGSIFLLGSAFTMIGLAVRKRLA